MYNVLVIRNSFWHACKKCFNHFCGILSHLDPVLYINETSIACWPCKCLGRLPSGQKWRITFNWCCHFLFIMRLCMRNYFQPLTCDSCSFRVFVAIFKIYCLSLNWLLLCCISQIIVVFHAFMLSIEANATSYREMRMRVWSNELLTLLFTL